MKLLITLIAMSLSASILAKDCTKQVTEALIIKGHRDVSVNKATEAEVIKKVNLVANEFSEDPQDYLDRIHEEYSYFGGDLYFSFSSEQGFYGEDILVVDSKTCKVNASVYLWSE